MNVESRPEPKFKRGDFVFSGIGSCAMKVINSCYDGHWRYQIFDDVNEYWPFEKELKRVEIGDVVYSKIWKEKVIVREFCDDKFILVADFNGKLLKSLCSLIKQIKDEKKYPKTYEECCDVLGIGIHGHYALGYKSETLSIFQNLIICRNAYWKIAGNEMGLGKPWEPSGNEDCFVISRSCGEVYLYSSAGDCEPFEFPTEEMRDAFKENFDPDIEFCKELL